MATESELTNLTQMLAGLTKPALRALCIRYGTPQTKIRLWSKRKDELVEDLLQHADHLLKGFSEDHSVEQSLTEIKTGQADLKHHISAERKALEHFLGPKLQVSKWEKLVNSTGSWASILSFLLALIILVWPKPIETYEIKIIVLDKNEEPVNEAKVTAPPWEPRAAVGYWRLSIPVYEVPSDGFVLVTAHLADHGRAEEKVRLAQHRQLSVTLKLRYPDAAITGIILSPGGEPLGGVQIQIFGHEKDAVFTKEDGSFSVPANVPEGEEVRLTAKKENLGWASYYIAGGHYEIRLVNRDDSKVIK